MAAFAYGQIRAKKRPRHGRRAEAACVGTPGWGGLGGKVGQPKVPELRYELGRLHSLDLLQALVLSLRIAHSLGQHLAQLSLDLCGFPLGWLLLGHETYVGMPERELNPYGRLALAPKLRNTPPSSGEALPLPR